MPSDVFAKSGAFMVEDGNVILQDEYVPDVGAGTGDAGGVGDSGTISVGADSTGAAGVASNVGDAGTIGVSADGAGAAGVTGNSDVGDPGTIGVGSDGAGAAGDVGDATTIGVGADGALLRQNEPKLNNLKIGRQKNETLDVDTAVVLVVRREDCAATVDVIAP